MKSDQYRGVLVIFVGVGIAASGVALSNVLSDELGLVGRLVFWIGWLVAGIGFIIHLRVFIRSMRQKPEPQAKPPWEK